MTRPVAWLLLQVGGAPLRASPDPADLRAPALRAAVEPAPLVPLEGAPPVERALPPPAGGALDLTFQVSPRWPWVDDAVREGFEDFYRDLAFTAADPLRPDPPTWPCANNRLTEPTETQKMHVTDFLDRDLPEMQDRSGTWPELPPGNEDVGLKSPRLVAVSLGKASARRARFEAAWRKLGLRMPGNWFPAMDGRDPRLSDAQVFTGHRGAEKECAADPDCFPRDPEKHKRKRMQFACWMSHQAAITQAEHAGSGDLLVVEDDVIFHPDFTAKLRAFVAAVPDDWDMLHLGGDAFWAPPIREEPGKYFLTRGASRTWAYVLRGRSLEKVRLVLERSPDTRAIDTMLAEAAAACNSSIQIKTYTPPRPIVTNSPGSHSDTSFPDMTNYTYRSPDQMVKELSRWNSAAQWETLFWMPTFCAMDQPPSKAEWKRWCCPFFATDEGRRSFGPDPTTVSPLARACDGVAERALANAHTALRSEPQR